MFDYAVLCDNYEDSASLFEVFCCVVHNEFKDSGKEYDYEIDLPSQTLYMFFKGKPAIRYIFIDHHMEPLFGHGVERMWYDEFFEDLFIWDAMGEWEYENVF